MGRGKKKWKELYIKQDEWKNEFGGKKEGGEKYRGVLPIHCCSLSLQPFRNPYASPEGNIYDLE